MVCQPIKTLIGCWLLVTSSFIHGDIARTAIYVKNVIEITSKRPPWGFGPTNIPRAFGKTSPTALAETSTDDACCSNVTSTNHGDSYDSISSPPLPKTSDDCDHENTNPSPSNLPVYLTGSFTSEDYESMTYVINIITVPVILLGVLASLVTIKVYMRMPRSVTSTFFRLATGMDVVYLMVGLPPPLMHLWLKEDDVMQDSFYVTYSIYVSVFFAGTLRKVIVCVTMLLSVDRVLLVAFPFRTKTYSHLRRPKLYTLIIAVSAFLLDSHILYRDKVSEIMSLRNATGGAQPCVEDDQKSQDNLFYDMYLVSSCLFQYTPLTLLVISNISLVVTLVRHSHRMKEKLRGGVQNIESDGGGKSYLKRTVVKAISYNSYSQEQCSDMSESRNEAKLDREPSEDSSVGSSGQNQDGGRDQIDNEGKGRADRKVTFPWRADRRRMALARCEKQHSVMVLIYSFIFTLLALPSALFPLLRKLIPGLHDFGQHHFLVLSLYSLFFLLNSISSAMNFFVCYLTGTAFRRGVSALFVRPPASRNTLSGRGKSYE